MDPNQESTLVPHLEALRRALLRSLVALAIGIVPLFLASPYVVIGVLALAALLTPPDIVSQIMLGLHTYLLFEIGLFASRRFKNR